MPLNAKPAIPRRALVEATAHVTEKSPNIMASITASPTGKAGRNLAMEQVSGRKRSTRTNPSTLDHHSPQARRLEKPGTERQERIAAADLVPGSANTKCQTPAAMPGFLLGSISSRDGQKAANTIHFR